MEKQYKYYAIRLQNVITVRRSLVGLRQITSTLTKPGTDFVLKQVSYTGGIVLGSMSYKDWLAHGGPALSAYKKLPYATISALRPYLIGGEKHGTTRGN